MKISLNKPVFLRQSLRQLKLQVLGMKIFGEGVKLFRMPVGNNFYSRICFYGFNKLGVQTVIRQNIGAN